MDREIVNEILGIKESYQLADKLLTILLDPTEKEKVFDKFVEAAGGDFSKDWFTEYFQNEQGDRNTLKQDFTPDSICKIATELLDNNRVIADICSGTGGLTLKEWQRGKAKEYYLVEYSQRSVPMLLLNLAIRNIKATVFNADALTREVFKVYKLTPTEKYSDIEVVEEEIEFTVDSVIMNPPYSMKWDYPKGTELQPRFFVYGLPPKSKSDYAFVLDGLSRLKEGGSLVAILPHGVLFRGAAEGEIRRKLIENNLIDTIIGLPDKTFQHTQIPVCIIKLKKDRKNKDVLFIDASKEFTKQSKYNVIEEKHIDKILSAIKLRSNIDKLSYVANLEEIKENDYNLNIPRYVDTYEPPEPIDIVEVTKSIYEIEKKKKENNEKFLELLNELEGLTGKSDELEETKKIWSEICEL